MCGIVAAIAKRPIEQILLAGLASLEYRGYDSAGMAVIGDEQQLWRLRAEGKVKALVASLVQQPLSGHIGIAHTRWATHGEPCERNAHPHISNNQIALVHNGIVENYTELRDSLRAKGYVFDSDTDTEVVAHLFYDNLSQTDDSVLAARMTAQALRGAFALGIINATDPQRLIAIRQGSPLVIGLGNGENFIASDRLALAQLTNDFIFLEDGDIAEIHFDQVKIIDATGEQVERSHSSYTQHQQVIDRGAYQHFMLKEIMEQPQAITETLDGRLSDDHVLDACFGPSAMAVFPQVRQVHIAACGTSFYAGLVAEYWLEQFAKIPCKVQIASEYRYRPPVVPANTLFVTISQSGETADTLAALQVAKQRGYLSTLAICNVAESSLVRETNLAFMTHAGPEIGVASTKAFTSQLTSLLLLTASLMKNKPDTMATADIVNDLRRLPTHIQEVLALDDQIQALAQQFVDKQHALFLGRGVFYPIALEGALKLKEISYIHAEAYPAGELKHGPLALIDKEMPVIAVVPNDDSVEKLKSNLQEVKARGGKLIVFAEENTAIEEEQAITVLRLPSVSERVAPIVYVVALQLLAYHVAVLKGTDVDQPRNLAKSVTVE